MDYYQGIVADYLRADRSRFVSPEYLLDLGNGGPLSKGCWWIDILAADFKEHTLFLCEVSYSKTLAALVRRLKQWSDNWDAIRPCLIGNTHVPDDWSIRPWVFIPMELDPVYKRGLQAKQPLRFEPKLSYLEETPPWRYPALSTLAAAAKNAGVADQPPEQS